jgi:CTP synthase (UTP-ammonia lyase)
MSETAALRLALVGDRGNHDEPAHPAIEALLPQLGFDIHWIPTTDIDDASRLDGFHGVWVVPGAPYHSQKGVHIAIRHAREKQLPFLGTCGGFFSALIEHAQNVLHLPEVARVDEDPESLAPLMIPLTCSLRPERSPLKLREDSRLARIYGHTDGVEEYLQCAYGLADYFMEAASQATLSYSAWDPDNAPRALEISDHPFFLGMLFQPELASTPDSVHPILAAFLEAVRASALAASKEGSAAL